MVAILPLSLRPLNLHVILDATIWLPFSVPLIFDATMHGSPRRGGYTL